MSDEKKCNPPQKIFSSSRRRGNSLLFQFLVEQLLHEYLWTCSNVINGLMTKSREHNNFVFFLVPTWHVRCCETETFLWMRNVNYKSDPIMNNNTRKPLCNFSSEKGTAEHRLVCKTKLLIILFKTISSLLIRDVAKSSSYNYMA